MESNLAQELWRFKRAASLEDVTRHYRKLCKLYHPDLKSPEDRASYERHMQDINLAYQDALQRFNIYTFKKPKQVKRPDRGGINIGFTNKANYTPHAESPKPKQGSSRKVVFSPIPNRLLSSALASFKMTTTFFSLKSAIDLRERVHFRAGLEELEEVRHRFPNSIEAQDALYYSAIACCNLKEYIQALKYFEAYRKKYAGDKRTQLFHFYEGVCNHRLGKFESAVFEYGRFILSKPSGIYSHFVALVATFQEAAEEHVVPVDLPYG